MFSNLIFSAVLPLNSGYGAEEDRTPDPLLAKQVLSQLSYSPKSANYQWWPSRQKIIWRTSLAKFVRQNYNFDGQIWWAREDSNR